ncbi:Golgi transport complex subunit 3 [Ascosphaera pollenicola]|nr:Golgi transport complex subunit 3 [Ascosphaera pollenicola]
MEGSATAASRQEDEKGVISVSQISNDAEYAQWYSGISDDLLEASFDEYQSYLDELEASKSHLDAVLGDTTNTLDLLSSLTRSFQAVEEQTLAFQKQCEGYLKAQEKGTILADNIRDNLRYYDFLEPASRRLNAPGAGNTVRSKEFSDMLAHLDECLDYMQTHPKQKEAEVYRSRYRLLMTRALTLVRGQFVAALRDISADVAKRIANRQLNDTTMSALLYAKFRVDAAEMKQIGLEIQKRAVLPIDADPGMEPEYQSLLNELHSAFSSARGKLIIPLIQKKMYDIAQAPSTSKDLVSFARASISYIRGICLDEYDLWFEWFHGQQGLYEFLESICEPLYDYIRPMILRETRLVHLCQLCTLLQTRYLSDFEDEGGDYSDNGTDVAQLDFSILIQPALEDAQSRLVFRTQSIMRTGIERFKPKPEDINYPEHNRQISFSRALRVPAGADSGSSHTSLPNMTVVDEEAYPSHEENDAAWEADAGSILDGWYPTLKTAIWLLSRIYRLVNSVVFDDLAHQIVHQTTLSLHTASSMISSKKTPADGQLFLIKHMLLLKQQIVAFDIEFVSTPDVSVDFFSAITGTFYELRERGGLFNPRNLVRLVGQGLMPTVIENMLDAKAELDGRLRTAINSFTSDFAKEMTTCLKIPPFTPLTTSEQQQKQREHLRTILEGTRKAIQATVPRLRTVLDDYIDDRRTRDTLLGAVQNLVVQQYEDFVEGCALALEDSRRAASSKSVPVPGRAKPVASRAAKNEIVDLGLWDVDTFGDWCETTFKISYEGALEQDDDIGTGDAKKAVDERASEPAVSPGQNTSEKQGESPLDAQGG